MSNATLADSFNSVIICINHCLDTRPFLSLTVSVFGLINHLVLCVCVEFAASSEISAGLYMRNGNLYTTTT